MLLSASEGRHWRYEVHEHADGYLVHMRDLETGDLVAFAYADMSAAYDRFAAAEAEEGCEPEDEEITTELELSERAFTDLSDRLRDAGVRSDRLEAWERARRSEPKVVHH